MPSGPFTILAECRGKELRLRFFSSKIGEGTVYLRVQPAMTGHFAIGSTAPAHTHLTFVPAANTVGPTLYFVDVRRFAHWESTSTDVWGPNRGPDPIDDFEAFRKNVEGMKRPPTGTMGELLMQQKYFNGVGNIYRAEILFRAGVDPFVPAAEFLLQKGKAVGELLKTVKVVLQESIAHQFAYTSVSTDGFETWLQVYGKVESQSVVDKAGRRLWYRSAAASPAKPATKKASGSDSSSVIASAKRGVVKPKKVAAKKPTKVVKKAKESGSSDSSGVATKLPSKTASVATTGTGQRLSSRETRRRNAAAPQASTAGALAKSGVAKPKKKVVKKAKE